MDQSKTKAQLIEELAEVRQQCSDMQSRLRQLEAADAGRERALAALRESEERYRLLVENAPVGIFSADTEGRILAVNPTILSMLGSPSAEATQAINVLTFPPLIEAGVSGDLHLCLQTGEPLVAERHYMSKWGQSIAGRYYVTPMRDVNDDVVGLQVIAEDISEHQRALEALRRRAEELAALQATVLDITMPHKLPDLLKTIVERAALLLDASGGGMYLCDQEQRRVRCVVSYNTPSDFTGTVLEYGEGAAGTVVETGEPLIIDDYRVWSRRAAVYEDEQPFTALLVAPMIWQEQVIGVVIVLDDVENRRFTQADLELLTLFANHAAVAVENTRLYEHAQQEIAERMQAEEALRDSETRYRTLSAATFEGVALTEQGIVVDANHQMASMLGYEVDELLGMQVAKFVAPEDRKFVKHRILSGGEEPYEHRAMRKDGRVIFVEVRPHMMFVDGRPTRVTAIRDVTERKHAEEQIKASLREKEVLLREIHHRVRNNLAIISALLSLQAESIDDPRILEVFKESQHRVRSMARVHEHLYRSQDLARINMAQYIQELGTYLQQSYGMHTVMLKTDVSNVALDIDAAIPCALIINELISNALKHAFPEGRAGEIYVGLHADDGRCELKVKDDGIGLPVDMDIEKVESLGLRLVHLLAQQLEGAFEWGGTEGTAFRLTFASKPQGESARGVE